jgi:hypothetical protein
VPVAHESGEADDQSVGEAQHRLRLAGRRHVREVLDVDAVRVDDDARRRHAARLDVAGEHARDRQHRVGVAPRSAFGPRGESREAQRPMRAALLGQRRVHLEQERDAEAPARDGARELVQVVALVDDVGTERARRTQEPRNRDGVVRELRDLVQRRRGDALGAMHPADLRPHRAARIARLGGRERRADDEHLVPERAQVAHHLVDMDGLAVARRGAMVVEDAQATRRCGRLGHAAASAIGCGVSATTRRRNASNISSAQIDWL